MNSQLIKGLISNTSMLLALSVLYSVMPFKSFKYKQLRSISIGILLGLVGIAIMASPFRFSPGIQFDTREILISITGMFFGLFPTLIAVILTSAYRIFLGGIGAISGVLSIIFSAAIGITYHKYRLKYILENRKFAWLELYFFSLLCGFGVILSTLLIPQADIPYIVKSITFPIFAIFPPGTIILGLLMLNQHQHHITYNRLVESEERYRSLFESNHAAMLIINPQDGAIIDANPAACEYYGWSRQQLQNLNIGDININAKDILHRDLELAVSKKQNSFHFKHKLSSGIIRDVEVYTGSVKLKGEKLIYSIIHDITEKKIAEQQLKESKERYKVTLLSVGDGVITTDRLGNITMINRVSEEITGWKKDEVIGWPVKKVFNIINEYSRLPVGNPVEKVLATGRIVGLANNTLLICKDGTEKPIADSAAPIKDNDGNILGTVLVFRDATEEVAAQQKISYLGYHDSLTNFYNRRFFDEELHRADVAKNRPISIIMGDVNGLKLANDAFGHMVGDQLLKEISNAIRKSCRKNDIIARWGGDEFIILLLNTTSDEAKIVCDQIKTNCAQIKIAGTEPSISLGYATKVNAEQDINSIIIKAEDMMYRNKLTEHQSIKANTINMILTTLHEKNPIEQLHSHRVSNLCKQIGQAMGLSDPLLNELGLAGLMHDIGKIAVRDCVLNKTEQLTAENWNEIKRHPEIGYRILNSSKSMSHIAETVLAHHERLDGSGYPKGLKGSEIPLLSRILAVADAYDAMISDRAHRPALPQSMAISMLKENSGIKFDPDVVKALVNLLGYE